MQAFCVYEVDYPEDGGTMYTTETEEEAIQQHRDATGTWGFEYGVVEMGPEHVAVYEQEEA